MERLSVWFQGMRAGTLDYDERTHSFTFGLEAEQKYQEEGGPTVGRCLRAIRGLRLGFAEQRKFLDYVIFNALIGNADAHGKNFSILYRGHRPEVAPLYDAMSTAIYEGATSRMAMYIGSAVSLADVTRKSFAELAKACDVSPKIVLDELDRLSAKICPQAKRLAESLSDNGAPSSVYPRIYRVIASQVEQFSRE